MTRPNSDLDLTNEDMDLIATALLQTQEVLSQNQMSHELKAAIEGVQNCDKARRVNDTMTQIQELLGRLNSRKSYGRSSGGMSVGA
ncbi:hypothetical protein [Shimia sediminis]|uniref:hypothetical protein n=1 Tax=Shimia sediminis TaxID=2497945 RepID=UPI000F8D3BC4|nr:hypothetical protein [Shimia sediminis]